MILFVFLRRPGYQTARRFIVVVLVIWRLSRVAGQIKYIRNNWNVLCLGGGGGCTAIISILIFQDQLLWQNIHSNQLSSDLGHPIGLAAEIWCIVQIFLTVFWVEIPSPAPAGPLLWIKSLATSPAKSYEWSPANWADLFTISSFRFPTLKKRTFKKSGNAVIFDFSFFQRHRMNVRSGSCAPKESANDRPERVLTKNGLIF